MRLSKQNLKNIPSSSEVTIPGDNMFLLPEKVLQFGTGVLLRGLPDYFIDKANQRGLFNGRIVVVKSTATGGVDAFDEQDSLYTVCVRGMEGNSKMEKFIINSSISRVLSAKENWNDILQCAHNEALQIIISNTTEVGITLTEDDIHLSPPHSFPGKLLSFLYERYKAFRGSKESGMVIIPTELIIDNGKKLLSIISELATMNGLEEAFIVWLKEANHFCNSLVDRIVPGKLNEEDANITEKKLGYKDELMIMAENFRLWAIESGDEEVSRILSFSKADEGVIIAPDIEKFRELKLRLLNGTHTFSCGLAYLAGFRTVKDAMNDASMAAFVNNLAINEIALVMSDDRISYEEAKEYARKVMNRFRNPFLEHQWINITLQYSAKMKMRNVPLLLAHYKKYRDAPLYMSLGFAAYLLFMKCAPDEKNNFIGNSKGSEYTVQDDQASYFAEQWKNGPTDEIVDNVLRNKNLWEADLYSLDGFADKVKADLHLLMQTGAMNALRSLVADKIVM